MLGRYDTDPQRHEMIACGTPTINARISPTEDITAMKAKIRALIPNASGSAANEKEGH
jgi:hypothetical protein